VLSYANAPDGKRVANSGDGWVLAVEFGKQSPRAYSVLAYGQSPDSTSPFHADQAEMFARGEMKPVRFTEADVLKFAIRQYRPGR
jgi:acyl-homoserine-lactone acylase